MSKHLAFRQYNLAELKSPEKINVRAYSFDIKNCQSLTVIPTIVDISILRAMYVPCEI